MDLSQATKIVTLLKYLDRSKITPEAVTELGQTLGWPIDRSFAAEVATAFRTRGQAGLLPLLPRLIALAKVGSQPPEPEVIVCAHCGHAVLARAVQVADQGVPQSRN